MTQSTNATSIFDDPSADFVLVTSDNAKYRPCRFIMTKASPVFEEMLRMPHPAQESAAEGDYVDGLPAVRVTEDSTTVETLLSCCYPVPNPKFKSPAEAAAVFRVGEKYQMEFVQQYASAEFLHLLRAQTWAGEVLESYGAAWKHGMMKEARAAARLLVDFQWSNVLERLLARPTIVDPTAFLCLSLYRSACRKAALALFDLDRLLDYDHQYTHPPLWDINNDFEHSKSCNSGGWSRIAPRIEYTPVTFDEIEREDVEYVDREWFGQYRSDVKTLLYCDSKEFRHAIREELPIQRAFKAASCCSYCMQSGPASLLGFINSLEYRLTSALDQVC